MLHQICPFYCMPCPALVAPECQSLKCGVCFLWYRYGLSCQRQTDVCVTRMPAIRAGNGALVNLPPEAYATDLARFLLTWSHVCFPCWSLLWGWRILKELVVKDRRLHGAVSKRTEKKDMLLYQDWLKKKKRTSVLIWKHPTQKGKTFHEKMSCQCVCIQCGKQNINK